jgi:hypothetical protein
MAELYLEALGGRRRRRRRREAVPHCHTERLLLLLLLLLLLIPESGTVLTSHFAHSTRLALSAQQLAATLLPQLELK